MNINSGNQSYTPKQVSELLGYQVDSVYALISRREIQSTKVGRNRFISQSQVNDFLLRRKVQDQIIDYTK
jgi:excisionase family DNA binding protein